jgi:dihydropteroate synthase
MFSVVKKYDASIVLMHIKGSPKMMQQDPLYDNVTEEVKRFLNDRAFNANAAGIEQIILDPGIGFGKKYEDNIRLLQEMRSFAAMNYPVLVGPSRKSFLGKILDLPPEERIEGTGVAVAFSILNGANIIRVHDIKEMKRAAMVADALKTNSDFPVQ